MTDTYTLYGAQISLFTGKAKAYLTYKNIPFEEVLSTTKVYKKIIEPNTGVRFIPVVKTPEGEYLQDTSYIIERLEERFRERPMLPSSPKQKLTATLFELFSDEWLVLPAMHYRWNKDNFPYIYEEFGRVVANWAPGFIRAFIGKKIGAMFRGFVPKLGIVGEMKGALEDWFEDDFLAHLNQHFGKYDYLLGDAACLGDIALMGPLSAHIYNDPAPKKMMQEKAPNVVAWIERLRRPCANPGSWLADDEVPESLLPILKRMFKEVWPVFESTVNAMTKQHAKDPNKVPRGLGLHSFTIGSVTESRNIQSFSQWKLQRMLDYYNTLSAEEKLSVQPWLTELDATGKLEMQVAHPVERVNNRLQFCN